MSENFANNWGVVSQKIILYCFDQVEKKKSSRKVERNKFTISDETLGYCNFENLLEKNFYDNQLKNIRKSQKLLLNCIKNF